jgi:hypothetical protein
MTTRTPGRPGLLLATLLGSLAVLTGCGGGGGGNHVPTYTGHTPIIVAGGSVDGLFNTPQLTAFGKSYLFTVNDKSAYQTSGIAGGDKHGTLSSGWFITIEITGGDTQNGMFTLADMPGDSHAGSLTSSHAFSAVGTAGSYRHVGFCDKANCDTSKFTMGEIVIHDGSGAPTRLRCADSHKCEIDIGTL